MSATGYTPILIYGSITTSNVPSASNLTTGATGVELAINAYDGKLFYKDSGGVVQVLATKGAAQNSISFGTTGLTPSTATQGAVTVAGTLNVANGGTGLTTLTAGYIPYGNGTSAFSNSANLYFDGNNLGVGTTAPYNNAAFSTLTLGGSGPSRTGLIALVTAAGTDSAHIDVYNTQLRVSTNGTTNPIVFYTGGSVTEAVRITSAGLVGIGTSTPSSKLDVSGPSGVTSFTSGTPLGITVRGATGATDYSGIDFRSAGANSGTIIVGRIGLIATGSGSSLSFGTSNSYSSTGVTNQAMTIDPNGNVGIGTSSPTSISNYKTITINGTTGSLFDMQSNGTTGGRLQCDATYPGLALFALTNNPMVFGTNSTERMRIDSSGNVGIGTSSPSYPLTVVGTVAATTVIANANIKITAGFSDSFAGGSYLWLTDSGASAGILQQAATSGMAWWNVGSATKLMSLDSSGNLGLGVTPSAWGSSYSGHLQLASGKTVAFAGTQGSFWTNAYINVGGNSLYATTAAAASYYQNAGTHAWYTAPSGTAGTAITYTQAMTLDNSGNLLVGTTATAAYQDGRLNVVGAGSQPAITGTISSSASTQFVYSAWSQPTSGNNQFMSFETETSPVVRGSITYNRAGGLVVYNTTSDYRAKNIIGNIVNSGEVIDSVPVYMGKMKDATQARPMFIAHETPDYAHTGEKDAVDKDGNPIYQQMDVSSLVPVLWAEVQSLRKRVAQLESK